MSEQQTGAQVLAALAPYMDGSTLRLATGALGGELDPVLAEWFGGTLVATVPAAQVEANDIRYTGAQLATAHFALATKAPTLVADIVIASDATDRYQLTVASTMPAGYQLTDSFSTAAGTTLATLALSSATFTIASTAATATATLTVAPADEIFGPATWLLPQPVVLTGTLALTVVDAKTYPVFDVASGTTTASFSNNFSLSAKGSLVSRVVSPKTAPALGIIIELVADLTAGTLTIPVVVAMFPGQRQLTFRIDDRRPPPAIKSLNAVSSFAAGADPGALLKDTPIGTLSLDALSCTLDLASREVHDITIAIGLGTHWPIVAGKFELAGLGVAVTIPNPYQSAAVSVTGIARLQVGTGMVDAYVIYPDKVVGAMLEPDSEIELPSLMSTFAEGHTLPGHGEFAITGFNAMADIAQQQYSLEVELDGKLTVYKSFIIEQLTLSISFSDGALDSLGFGSIFSIAGVELALSAAYAAGSWALEGGTYESAQINLSTLVADLLTTFGLSLPAKLPEILLSGLDLKYNTGTGAYSFTGTVTYLDPKGLLSKVSGTLTIDSTGAGSVAGELDLGTSVFTVKYDFSTAQTVAFAWQIEANKPPFGIAALCTALGVKPPAIPPGLDLGLDAASFTYHRDTGAVLLSAHSVHYGYALFQAQPIAGAQVYVFGIDVPLHVLLSDIPLVGDKIPDADQLGITSLGAWLLSRPLLKPEAEVFNSSNTAPGTYPRLPDAAMPAQVTFYGSLLLGSTTIPISVPIGGTQPSQPALEASAEASTTTPPALPVHAGAPAPPAPADSTKWFPVQRTFGVFTFDRIGVNYVTDGSNTLFFVLDASVAVGPMTLSLLGLAVGSELTKWDPSFTLRGLGLSYDTPPLSIEGALYALPADQLKKNDVTYQYDGVAVVTAGTFSLAAIGSFARLTNGDPSLFLFAQLRTPLGGPPAFFVTGLMGGFGVNRSLALPAQDQVIDFPLLALASAPVAPAPAADPATVLQMLEGTIAAPDGIKKAWITPQAGESWLAVGVEFTSFELVDTKALLIAEFGTEFALALLGLSTMRLPQGAGAADTYAYVELELAAVFRPAVGFFGLSAVLAPSSYVIAPTAKLTGGFAFYVWFGESPYAGQFVVTLGGYHPAFRPLSYFPVEPRLGIAWAVSDVVSIKGSAYFALTNSAVMAGGGLEVVYQSGALRAWFTAHADMLIAWHPFSFLADIDVGIGISYTLDLFGVSKTLAASLGASVSLWGPPTGGTATVHLWFISFTVHFGAVQGGVANDPLTPNQFASMLPKQPVTVAVTDGLSATVDDQQSTSLKRWLVRAGGLSFATASALPVTTLAYGHSDGKSTTDVATGLSMQVRPMDLASATGTHTVRIQNTTDSTWVDVSAWTPTASARPLPASLWGAPLKDRNGNFTQLPPPSADLVPAVPVGASIVVPLPTYGANTGLVDLSAVAYEPVTLPGDVAPQAPCRVGVTAAAEYVPAYSATSVGSIADIAGVAARGPMVTALAHAALFDGPSDDMSLLGTNAADEFSDPPLLAGSRS